MKPTLLLPLLLCLLFATSPAVAKSKQQLMGKVLGKRVYLDEIETKKINDLRQDLYQEKLTVFKVNSLAILSKTKKEYSVPTKYQIPEDTLRNFYDGRGLAAKGSFEDFKPRIHAHLSGLMLLDRVNQLYARAVRKKLIRPLFHEPPAMMVTVPLGTAYTWGKPNKKQAVILEFSDYHCPYCNRFKATMDQVRVKYKGKALFGYRHYPLSFHERADEAAIAAECAREQGKFAKMHDLLYENQSEQSDVDYKFRAIEAKVKDLDQFVTCLKEEKYRSVVRADQRDADKIGITATPSMVIGTYDPKTKMVTGEVVSGAMGLNDTEAILKKYMR